MGVTAKIGTLRWPVGPRRDAEHAVVKGRREDQIFPDAEVPIGPENVVHGIGRLFAEPHSRNRGDVQIRTQASEKVDLVPALKVRCLG